MSSLNPESEPNGPETWVREEVQRLKVYHLDLTPCRHKLDQNEVPYELPAAFKRRIAEQWTAAQWAKYPDFHSDRVRELLADRHRWPMEGILVGNGSNELLGVTLEAISRPGGEALATIPSFGLYRMFIERAALKARFVSADGDLKLPMAALLEEVAKDPSRPVILCSPNNPTGDAVSVEQVEELLSIMRAPLLLDNAYGEFCRHDYRPLLQKHRHLVLFRTFSKAWSLGGLRLGYLMADPELVHQLMKVKLPYNVGLGHGLAAQAVLEQPAAAERRVRAILGRRPQWQAMLRLLGFEVFDSEANFFLARVPEGHDVDRIRAGLETRSIRVRDVSKYPGLSGCMRVSVGSGRALRDVRIALEDILSQKSSSRT